MNNWLDSQIFLKFLFLGIIFGVFYEICKIIKIVSKDNVFITNTSNFLFFCTFGVYFCSFLTRFAGGEFQLFTIFSSILGFVLEQNSIGFFFTFARKLLYNVSRKVKNKIKSTKLGSKILR